MWVSFQTVVTVTTPINAGRALWLCIRNSGDFWNQRKTIFIIQTADEVNKGDCLLEPFLTNKEKLLNTVWIKNSLAAVTMTLCILRSWEDWPRTELQSGTSKEYILGSSGSQVAEDGNCTAGKTAGDMKILWRQPPRSTRQAHSSLQAYVTYTSMQSHKAPLRAPCPPKINEIYIWKREKGQANCE